MKVRMPETGVLEFVKIEKDKDDAWTVKLEDMDLCSHLFLLGNYEIVEIERGELKSFHEFLNDTRIHLAETEEFFQGKMAAYDEMNKAEKEDDDEEEDEKGDNGKV